MDFIISLPRFPAPNTSVSLSSSKIYYGGTGGNIARTAARLGVPTSLSAFVGENFPNEYLDTLAGDGVIVRDVITKKGYLTPTCWIMGDPNQDQIAIIDQGPMGAAGKFQIQKYTVDNSKILHITTGNPDYYLKIIEYSKKLKRIVSFDPAQEIHHIYNANKFKAVLRNSNYFFANENECKTALKYLGTKDIYKILDFVDHFILTKGKQGSIIYSKENEIKIPIVRPKKIVDPTGAGDAYRAGFYAGLFRKKSIKSCGLLGACASSFALESPSPQSETITWNLLLKRLKEQGHSI